MKHPWDRVKLRVAPQQEAPTEHPVEGDELHTSRGRRYLVLSYTERLITALVLPKGEPLTKQRVWRWTWGARPPRA
jgi:hypothetical protein